VVIVHIVGGTSMLYPKILLVLVGLCILTSSWTPAAAQPTLPIESIPEDLPPKLRAALAGC